MISLIETGTLKRKKTGIPLEEVGYKMMFLDAGHLEDAIILQGVMAQNLQDKEIFKLTTPAEFNDLLSLQRRVIGVFTEDGLIAYNVICFPGRDSENFGVDINLPKSELEKVAHLKAVVVHPAYRGNQLQKRLAKLHLEVLRELGYKHVCSTVSPKNDISIQNYFDSGFVIMGLKVKYTDRLRYIMYKNIFHDFVPGPEAVGIMSTDIDGQKRWIDRGFAGFKIRRSGDRREIVYCMPAGKLF